MDWFLRILPCNDKNTAGGPEKKIKKKNMKLINRNKFNTIKILTLDNLFKKLHYYI